ncbi:MAG: hypothetical protein ACTSRW_10005 [Candidatus Helarchaeota archaeon]
MSGEGEDTEEIEIPCETCEWFLIDKKGREKCKYVKEKDRMKMLESNVECPEYQLRHDLQI